MVYRQAAVSVAGFELVYWKNFFKNYVIIVEVWFMELTSLIIYFIGLVSLINKEVVIN